jgi:phage terminase large subunit
MLNTIELPEKIVPVIFGNVRYKVLRGGRGSAKSWSIARYLVLKTAFGKFRILCTREMQNSIKDSVYKLLVDQIYALDLQKYFEIQKEGIASIYGSQFIFKGLHHNISEIKSTEGIDICWVEEAEKVSEDSWTILIPTIRNEASEILISFNPEQEKSSTYTRFAKNPPPDCLSIALTFEDNPWFPEVLRREMEYDKRVDYEKYEYVWLGKPKKYSQALIFPPSKIKIEEFEASEDTRLYFGADFGFSTDPTILVRMFRKDRKLYIDYEAYGHGIELLDLPQFFKTVPGAFESEWKIIADSARPDTINFLRQEGFCIEGAEKGKGSVEDGIEFIRSFEEIIIHPRCTGTKDNFENYKWKQDKITGEILPIPAPGSDHAPDAVRYALESYIKNKVSCFDVL